MSTADARTIEERERDEALAKLADAEAALREIATHRCQLVRDGLYREPGGCGHVNPRHPKGSCGPCIARRYFAKEERP